jgi:sugar phosphate isomerase/epimerase
VFCTLGDGSADLRTFAARLRRSGYDGWATYEQDRVASDHPRARADAERSVAHMHTLGIREQSRTGRYD